MARMKCRSSLSAESEASKPVDRERSSRSAVEGESDLRCVMKGVSVMC